MATQPHSEVPVVHHLGLKPVSLTPADLLQVALQHNAAIDVIERLAALQEKAMLRDAEITFNDAKAKVQSEIKRIAPDLENPQTRSRYASYAALDRVVRPIYSREGFSISFSTEDCPKPDHVRVIAWLSLGAWKEKFQIDMPSDGKGAKGGDVMTKTHATAAATSYGMRYLVKGMWNIAIGEDDDDGNLGGQALSIPQARIEQLCARIRSARNIEELTETWTRCANEVMRANDRHALNQLRAAKDARKRELQ